MSTDLPERFSLYKDEMLKEKGIPRIEGAVETIKISFMIKAMKWQWHLLHLRIILKAR